MMFPSKREQAIGIFDSGFGGLTVMREVVRLLPHEKIVYFGDTARLPYGDKSPETIVRYTVESAIFLMEQNIKMLVVACNTASAHALSKLQTIFNIPIIEVIEPGAMKAADTSKTGKIAVLGTKATIQSGAYERKIRAFAPHSEVHSIACPLFVPFVEEGLHNHLAASLIAEHYLGNMHQHQIDTMLLGCTHYPILKDLIQKVVGDHVQIVDSATTCAEKVAKELCILDLKNSQNHPNHEFFVSNNPEKFQLLGGKFLGAEISNVSLASSLMSV